MPSPPSNKHTYGPQRMAMAKGTLAIRNTFSTLIFHPNSVFFLFFPWQLFQNWEHVQKVGYGVKRKENDESGSWRHWWKSRIALRGMNWRGWWMNVRMGRNWFGHKYVEQSQNTHIPQRRIHFLNENRKWNSPKNSRPFPTSFLVKLLFFNTQI